MVLTFSLISGAAQGLDLITVKKEEGKGQVIQSFSQSSQQQREKKKPKGKGGRGMQGG